MPKNKTAVREKSGCYTCRIRRKKCDGRRVGQEGGPCDTCSRLRLECLGFGARRPPWLKDTNRVSEIRDRIKSHLAAQGLIKGRVASGSRNPLYNEILSLSDYHSTVDMGHGDNCTSFSGGIPVCEGFPEADGPHHDGQAGHRQHSQLPPPMSPMRGFDYHTSPYNLQPAGLMPPEYSSLPVNDWTLHQVGDSELFFSCPGPSDSVAESDIDVLRYLQSCIQ